MDVGFFQGSTGHLLVAYVRCPFSLPKGLRPMPPRISQWGQSAWLDIGNSPVNKKSIPRVALYLYICPGFLFFVLMYTLFLPT